MPTKVNNAAHDFGIYLQDLFRIESLLSIPVNTHSTILGNWREGTVRDFLTSILPKKYETLSASLAAKNTHAAQNPAYQSWYANRQFDISVVDTFQYPTLLRKAHHSFVFPHAVRVILESKGSQSEIEALAQIAQYCFITIDQMLDLESPDRPTSLGRFDQIEYATDRLLTVLIRFADQAKATTIVDHLNAMVDSVLYRMVTDCPPLPATLSEIDKKPYQKAAKNISNKATYQSRKINATAAQIAVYLYEQYQRNPERLSEKPIAELSVDDFLWMAYQDASTRNPWLSFLYLPDLVINISPERAAFAFKESEGRIGYALFDETKADSQPSLNAVGKLAREINLHLLRCQSLAQSQSFASTEQPISSELQEEIQILAQVYNYYFPDPAEHAFARFDPQAGSFTIVAD